MHKINLFFVLLLSFLIFFVSCRSSKNISSPREITQNSAAQSEKNVDTTIAILDGFIKNDSIIKQDANVQKKNKNKKENINKKKEIRKPLFNICNICEGVKMARKAKELITPPDEKGCFAPLFLIIWIIMLPILLILAMLLYVLAIITIILYIIIISLILLGFTILILSLLGLITSFSLILSLIGSVIVAIIAYKLICNYCK